MTGPIYRGCLTALVLAAVVTAGCETQPPRRTEPPRAAGDEALSPDESRNRYVFRQRCAGCHGRDGEGVPEVGPEIRTRLAALDDTALRRRINQGGKQMPAFQGKVTAEEFNWLIAHLRKLQEKK